MRNRISRLTIRWFAGAALLTFLAPWTGSAHAAAPGARPRTSDLTISIDDVKVLEDEGDIEAYFTVSLSAPSPSPVSVDYQTHDGTATVANNDYVPASGTLTIPANTLTGTITVIVVGDATFEGDETFTVDLSNPVGATILDGQGVGTISNNDPAPQISVANVTVAEGDSGTTAVVLNAVLSNPSGTPVSFQYQTVDGTATVADGDYAPASGTVTIPAKTLLVTFTVLVNGDRVFEPTESFTVQLSNASGATLANTTSTVKITNDDAAPVIQIDDIKVIEGNSGTTPAVFTVSLTHPTYQTVTMQYQTEDETTQYQQDFIEATGVLTIPPKTSSVTVVIQVKGDTEIENDETFNIVVDQPVNASLGPRNYGTCTISNDDGIPHFSITGATVAEGDSGTTSLVFKISLDPQGDKTTVAYHTVDSTATVADGDYLPQSGILSFAPGETSKTLVVTVNGDTKLESDETMLMVLSTGSQALSAAGTIVNDDSSGATVTFADAPPTPEGSPGLNVGNPRYFKFPITISPPIGFPIQVTYHTEDGTATVANNDYLPTQGTLTIPPNAPSDTIFVGVLIDTKFENDETFFVRITNVQGATDGGPDLVQGTILNDDGVPQIQVTNGNTGAQGKNEGNSGKAAFPIHLSLVGSSIDTVECDWHTADDVATLANGDYQAASGHVLFPPKTTTATITIYINGDIVHEDWETLAIVLTDPLNATLRDFGFGPGVGLVTIQDDDPEPLISIDDVTHNEGDSGTTDFVFTLHLNRPSSAAVSVHWAAEPGTATPGDYNFASGIVSFGEKETEATVTVQVNGDTDVEPDETFQVHLTSPQHGTIRDPFGLGTIVNDDGGPTPTLVTQFRAEPVVGGVSLHWQLLDAARIASVDVERSENEIGPWSSVMSDRSDESGVIGTVDHGVAPGRAYYYRLEVRDRAGNVTMVGPVRVQSGELITAFALGRVMPNPSRSGQPVSIEYALPRTASIRVSLLDVQGREVAVLVSGMKEPGRYQATWNVDGGKPAGLYFVRYQFPGGKAQVQRLALAR